jgi:hypothetical protein
MKAYMSSWLVTAAAALCILILRINRYRIAGSRE